MFSVSDRKKGKNVQPQLQNYTFSWKKKTFFNKKKSWNKDQEKRFDAIYSKMKSQVILQIAGQKKNRC